ncbi:MAG: ABC transporter substrate binding protein, partial [Candidatus Sulfotelmatobacter sp.]
MREVRRVLIINDLGVISSPGFGEVNQAVLTGLQKSPYRIELYEESLDLTLFPDRVSQDRFRGEIIRKYSARKPDVIIAAGPESLKFIANQYDKFQGTPIIFCAILGGIPDQLRHGMPFTGVLAQLHPEGTLNAALHLLPSTKHVVVVGGVGKFDEGFEAIAKQSFHNYESKLEFTYLFDLTMPALRERLKHLANDTIVYHTAISQDAAGDYFIDSAQSIPMVASAANAPVFVMDDVDLRAGTVGGDLVNWADDGRIAAEMAARVLNGEKPQDIPVVTSNHAYMFDWRALKRWGVNEKNLPPGSIVLNRQLTVWESYKWYIISGIALILLEALLIGGLVWQRAELKGSEERHRVIVEAASDAVISMDENGGILLANPATARIFGYDPVELIGKPLTVLMPEFMRKLHQAGFRRYLATGERHLNWQTEVIALRNNGQEFPAEVSFGEITSSGHKGFTGFVRDISEKKRAEDELRSQKEVFQKIFENIPVMIAFFDADGRIELVNPEWQHTAGWTLKEIREHNLDLFVELYPDPQYRQMARDYAAAPPGEWTEFKVRTRDGRVIDTSAYSVRLSDGSTLGIARDITERKRAEAELRESEARFRLVADSAPVMIWMSGTDKLCTYFNKPWLDFTGRSIERELGNGWAEGVDPEDLQRCLDTYTQAFDRRETFRMEYRLRRHDGEFRLVSDIGVPRFNPDGSFAGYIGSCIDVTEQRRAEEHLRRAQEDLARVSRVVAMGELAAAIAHEVNQPLGAVVTNASASLRWLAGQPPNLGEAREAIDRTVREANRASEVIVRIRALFQKVPPRMEQLDVNVVIREVLTLAGNELLRSGIAVQTDLAPDLPNVFGDR